METDDEAAAEHARAMAAIMPFSIIGSVNDVTTADGRVVKGREYLWGVAEGESSLLWGARGTLTPVENEDHCDFKKLRGLLIRTYMLDLITTTEEAHYEAYRLAQMETRKFGEPKVRKIDNPKYKEEEEMLRKRFTEQVKLEESRFRQWEQHVSHKFGDCKLTCSSLPRGTDSTRTWSTLTRLSRRSRWVECVIALTTGRTGPTCVVPSSRQYRWSSLDLGECRDMLNDTFTCPSLRFDTSFIAMLMTLMEYAEMPT